MLGHSHAVSGALGWLATAPIIASSLGQPLTTGQLAAGTLTCAGAALLPDLDHPQATIAQFLGPPSVLLSKGVNLLAGGHRMATHSFLFVALAGVGTQALLTLLGLKAALWVIFISTALACRGLGLVPPGKRSSITSGLTVAAEAFMITYFISNLLPVNGGYTYLPLAVALGTLFHLAGDCCTPERCPLLWPKRTRYGAGIITHTGNALETKIITPLMSLALAGLVWQLFLAPAIHTGKLFS